MRTPIKDQIFSTLNHPNLSLPIDLTPSIIDQTQKYLELLCKWNRTYNLTSEKEVQSILEKHFFDSLQYLPYIKENFKVMDIGSGPGFPGIPVKIFSPCLEILLVESRRKRVNFLKLVIKELEMEKAHVYGGRSEELQNLAEHQGQYDCVLFRAVGRLEECLQLADPFLKTSGTIVVKKGSIESEGKNTSLHSKYHLKSQNRIKDIGGKLSLMLVFEKK